MLIRENYLSKIRGFYDSDLVKILVGIRRCGKSVILNQIINEIKEKKQINDNHIININFEFIEYEELRNYKLLNKYIKDKIADHSMYYVFLDEIQNVDKFELVINSLRASLKNISIFVTGSNSKMLSEELSTVLSGRYVLFNIYPLSYKEYIGLTKKDAYDKKSFWNYAKWGGLPNRCEFSREDDIKNYLHNVYDSIILRDIVKRLNLQDTILFDKLLEYIIDTIGREFSADNVINYLKKEYKSISTETLYLYLDALCKALIIKKVHRYDVHGKSVLKTLNKYYVIDLGIAQINNHNKEFNNYIILENIVFNELIVRGYDVYIGKTKSGEIDFVAKKDESISYYQVAYSLSDNSVLDREFGAFKNINDSFPKYVISLDDMDFSKDGIINVNLIDFLMQLPKK